MTSDLTIKAAVSPFDAVRLFDEGGREYWSARSLMPMLGYDRWERFEDAVERAEAAINNSEKESPDHIRGAAKMVTLGSGAKRNIIDYHLTRYGAYMVAMNSDPRKAAVAAAQTYFAVRTREAETTTVALTEDQIVAQALQITSRRVEQLEARVIELEPSAKAWTHMASSAGDYLVGDAAKILSRDPAITIGRDRLFAFMAAEGWIYRGKGRRNGWRAYQTQVECGRLVEKMAPPFLNQKTGDMELPEPTIRITAKGLAELHRRLGGTQELTVAA